MKRKRESESDLDDFVVDDDEVEYEDNQSSGEEWEDFNDFSRRKKYLLLDLQGPELDEERLRLDRQK